MTQTPVKDRILQGADFKTMEVSEEDFSLVLSELKEGGGVIRWVDRDRRILSLDGIAVKPVQCNGKSPVEPKPWDLVRVKWVDSAGATAQWMLADDFTSELCACESVGWIVHIDEHSISVAPHIADDREQVVGVMVIPQCAVASVAILESAK